MTFRVGMFPGQGSQFVGMGKDLCQNFSIARQTFEEASEAVRIDLRRLCWDGSESDLRLTENTQPALLAVSTATYRVLIQETDWRADLVLGHSLGEYSALCAAGAIDLMRASLWVRKRGQAMQAAVPVGEGTMLALLGGERETLITLCQEASRTADSLVVPANWNAPGQVVVSGTTQACECLTELLRSDPRGKGIRALPLPVSAPFHSPLMEPAKKEMAALLQGDVAPLLMPYIPNVTARPHQEKGLVLNLLTEQITAPVLWQPSVEWLLGAHDTIEFLEIGPGKVLQGLVKKIAGQKNPSIRGVSDTTQLRDLTRKGTI